MAKKSKTQRAKAQANRAAKKAAKVQAEQEAQSQENVEEVEEKEEKKSFFSRKKTEEKEDKKEKTAAELRQERRDKKMAEKENKPKKQHGKIVQFFIDVRAEMKRVTWPTKKDVAQWTGVVIGALLFFGVYIALLDNFVVIQLLRFVSRLGSS